MGIFLYFIIFYEIDEVSDIYLQNLSTQSDTIQKNIELTNILQAYQKKDELDNVFNFLLIAKILIRKMNL